MPMPLRDLSGQRFGLFTVIERTKNNAFGSVRWICKCDCGTTKPVLAYTLTQGQSRSCGCIRKGPKGAQQKFDRAFVPQERGALSVRFPSEYRSWNSMHMRCNNPKAAKYDLYGGRGIKVCKRWMKFENFLKDMGNRPKGTTLDRKNSDRLYCQSNCRWAKQDEQHDNRRSTIFVTTDSGERISLRAFAKRAGIPRYRFMYHVNKGHDLNACLRSMKSDGVARCHKRWKSW